MGSRFSLCPSSTILPLPPLTLHTTHPHPLGLSLTLSSSLSLSSVDRLLCLSHWKDIQTNQLASYLHCQRIRQTYPSCRDWLDSLILEELMTTNLRFKSIEDQKIFLYYIYEMIQLRLKEWDDIYDFHNEIAIRSHRLVQLGYDSRDLIAFVPTFLVALRTISGPGNDYFSEGTDSDIERAWRSVCSSILSVSLPFFVHSSLETFSALGDDFTCDRKDHIQHQRSSSQEKLPHFSSATRLYATLHNEVNLDQDDG